MRRTIILFFLLFVTVEVQAQLDTRVALRFSGGAAFPTNPADLSDNWKMGPTYQFDFEYPVEDGEFAVLGSYHTASFAFDQYGFLEHFDKSLGPTIISSVKGPDASIWGITIGGKLNLASGPAYIRFDLGYFSISRGNVTVSGPGKVVSVDFISKTAALVNLGLGYNLGITGSLALFVEGNYYLGASNQDEETGYIVYYSGGGGSPERKNSWIGGLKAGLSVRLGE